MVSKRKATNLIFRFFKYFKPYKWLVFTGFVCLLLHLALSIVQPILSKLIIDKALINKNIILLNQLGLTFLGVAVFSYLISSVREYIFLYIQQKVSINIREDLSEHILNLPMSFHNYQNPGYLMARVNDDVGNLSGLMTDKYVQALVDVLTLICASVILISLSWQLALLSLSLLPAFIISVRYFSKKIHRQSTKLMESQAHVSSSLQDIFSSIFTIRIFNKEKSEINGLLKNLWQYLKINLKMVRLRLTSNLTMGCIATLAPLCVIWYGGFQVINGQLTIGSLFAFNMYLAFLFNPIRNIYATVQTFAASMASLERIYKTFDTPLSEIANTPSGVLPKKKNDDAANELVEGAIEFRDVSFSYQDDVPVLKEISFKVEPNQTIALVGPSGAGKSTIFSLLMRLYERYSGRILIDGENILEKESGVVRQSIRIAPQEPYLFNRSILDNIAFGGTDASREDVIRAAEIAKAHDFITKIPNGYDSIIGQRGVTLSGGEKQRISLARALVGNPRILLLDEATAFLDTNTESLVQMAIDSAVESRTCMIIAHRLTTVLKADKIIVLNNGGIEDSGTHEELYSKCELYRELCDKQFKKITEKEGVLVEKSPVLAYNNSEK